MSYIEQNLIRDEKIIKKATLHWFIYIKALFSFLLALIFIGSPDAGGIVSFFMLLSIVLLVVAIIQKYTTELAVTNKRVIAKHGLISRNTVELNLSKIEGLNVNQSIMGRIFNFGDIIVSGTGGKRSPIRYIENPLDFRRTVNEELEN